MLQQLNLELICQNLEALVISGECSVSKHVKVFVSALIQSQTVKFRWMQNQTAAQKSSALPKIPPRSPPRDPPLLQTHRRENPHGEVPPPLSDLIYSTSLSELNGCFPPAGSDSARRAPQPAGFRSRFHSRAVDEFTTGCYSLTKVETETKSFGFC